ncbi:hypothetical protein AAG747_13005 [Rapidithrix thailandica]|uniref:Uncharacterized protein n=1 Tax=Rapidithrix thailandica TaxID=413964 RepID=A0AAW9S8T8_9BACT
MVRHFKGPTIRRIVELFDRVPATGMPATGMPATGMPDHSKMMN